MIDQLDPTLREGMRIVGRASDYDGTIAAIKARILELELSYDTVDVLAGFTDAYTSKLLGDTQSRQMTWRSFLALTETLGLSTVFVVDPKLVEQMKPHWERGAVEQRRTSKEARLGKATLARVFPSVLKEHSRRMNEARKQKLSPAKRRAIARKAGKASGRARLRKGLIEAAGRARVKSSRSEYPKCR